jgi:hypothetical protein
MPLHRTELPSSFCDLEGRLKEDVCERVLMLAAEITR